MAMRNLTLGFILIIASFSLIINGQTPTTLLISNTAGSQVSRHIYGHFAELLGRCIYDGIYKDRKIRMNIVEALRKIKVPNMRSRKPRVSKRLKMIKPI